MQQQFYKFYETLSQEYANYKDIKHRSNTCLIVKRRDLEIIRSSYSIHLAAFRFLTKYPINYFHSRSNKTALQGY